MKIQYSLCVGVGGRGAALAWPSHNRPIFEGGFMPEGLRLGSFDGGGSEGAALLEGGTRAPSGVAAAASAPAGGSAAATSGEGSWSLMAESPFWNYDGSLIRKLIDAKRTNFANPRTLR